MLQRDLARQQAEQEGLVHRLHRIVMGEGEFELRGIIFGGDAVQLQPRRGGFIPDGIGEADRIGEPAGGVDIGARGLIGDELARLVALEGIGLELQPDLGRVAECLPFPHRALQQAPPAERQWRAAAVCQIRHDDLGIRLPARTDVGGLVDRVHIGQAVAHLRARRRQEILVIADGEDALAEA